MLLKFRVGRLPQGNDKSFVLPPPFLLGAMRSHLSDFKKHRAARIDHYVVEVNKLIIRLEKVNFFVLKHVFFSASINSLKGKITFLLGVYRLKSIVCV